MKGNEIKVKIDELSRQIEERIITDHFTLNKDIMEIENKIADLQAQCPHQFENGICIYCQKENIDG